MAERKAINARALNSGSAALLAVGVEIPRIIAALDDKVAPEVYFRYQLTINVQSARVWEL
jgi:hypothetical protein